MLLSRVCSSTLMVLTAAKRHLKVQLSNSQARKRARAAARARGAQSPFPMASSPAANAVVLYHYPCPDGVFAALAAHLYHSAVGLRALFLPNTVYQPLRVQDLNVEGVDVFYLLDFAGPDGFALELARKAKQVIVLDHHKTALGRLPENGEGPANLVCILDMKRSGATIAYDYFEEKLSHSRNLSVTTPEQTSLVPGTNPQQVKDLFKYIEDADLWRWTLPYSRAFTSGLNDMGIEFNAASNPGVFEKLLELDAKDMIAKGQESLKAKQAVIDELLGKSFQLELGRGQYGQCLAVRADNIAHLRSELGNQLAAKSLECGLRPVGAVVYVQTGFEESERLYKVSLRSVEETTDTTEISEAYGGGGHRKASSFLIGREEFEKWKV